MSFGVILPFLRPIAHLTLDPAITGVMVNGSGRVFVKRDGPLEAVTDVAVREQNLRLAVRNLARPLGDDVSGEQPLLDSLLADGSRVAAALPPVSLGGTTLTIRKFQSRHFTADELARIGTLIEDELAIVRRCIEAPDNTFISGGTCMGKTTLLNALAPFLPADDQRVLIEEAAELQVDPEPGAVRGQPPAAGSPGGQHSRLVTEDLVAPPRSHSRERGPGR